MDLDLAQPNAAYRVTPFAGVLAIAGLSAYLALPAGAQTIPAQSARALQPEPGTELFAYSGTESPLAVSNLVLQRTSARELNPTRLAPYSARKVVQQEDGISIEQQLAFELLGMTSGTSLPTQEGPPLAVVSLEDAVRETVKKDFALRIGEQDVMRARGARRGAAGSFDLTLFGKGDWNFENTAVTDDQYTVLRLAQKTRRDVARVLREVRGQLAEDIRELERGGVPEDPVDFSELIQGLNELGFQIDFEGLDPATIGLDPSAELITQAQVEALRDLAGGEETFQRLVVLEAKRRQEILGLYELVDRILEDAQEQQERDRRRAEGIAYVNNQKNLNYNLGLRRLLRNGLTLSTGVEFERKGKSGRNNPTTNRSKIFGDITLPVGKRSGQTSVWAEERAAILDLDGATWRLRQTATTSVRRTVRAYWEVVAAQQTINILNRSLTLSYDLMRETDRRLQAGRATASENVMALARYQEVLAERSAAEKNLFAARRELSLAMGWDAQDGDEITVFPTTNRLFAAPIPIEQLEAVDAKALAKEAVSVRPDVLAQRDSVEAARILRDAARRDRLPRSDFGLRMFYGVVDEGSEYELLAKVYQGTKTYGGFEARLDIEWPFGNNRALGELAEKESEIIRQEIRLMDIERQITARLLVAYAKLYTTLGEMRRNDLAYKSYGKAREYQLELFANGRSTSGQMIEAEQRLTDAGKALVNAIKAHNQALIDFNFESGNLLTRGVGPIDINYANLDALPHTGLPTPVNRATPAPVLDPNP